MTEVMIGIDPGTKTGFAVWDLDKKEFIEIKTLSIVTAFENVLFWQKARGIKALRFEDSRLRSWFAGKGREALQGAGSIKRDCSIWQEFCEYHQIDFEPIKPMKGQTKWNSGTFAKLTKWRQRTSEHSRDAGILVFGL